MSGTEVERRDVLMAPYEHPYRHWLPTLWRIKTVRRQAYWAGLLPVGAAIAVAGSPPLGVSVMFAGVVALAGLAVTHVRAAWHIRGIASGWRAGGELERVRRRRPHAGERDPDVAHDEYAVTVEEDGQLLVWRFRALRVDERVRDEEILVLGRPCHAADVIEEAPFDPRDAGVAAEQLAAAQARAAELEAAARADANRRLAAGAQRRELEAETRSTAEALQHLTGQRQRQRRRR